MSAADELAGLPVIYSPDEDPKRVLAAARLAQEIVDDLDASLPKPPLGIGPPAGYVTVPRGRPEGKKPEWAIAPVDMPTVLKRPQR